MTSLDACLSRTALDPSASSLRDLRLRFDSRVPGFSEPAPNTYRDSVSGVVAPPCPRNLSVPSLVHSKSTWLTVQLSPGSREGQSSSKERSSAPRESSEGRRISNQDVRVPGAVQETTRASRLGLGPCFSIAKRAQLGGWIIHLRSFHRVPARKRSISKTRSLVRIRYTARPSFAARIESALPLPCLPASRRRWFWPSGLLRKALHPTRPASRWSWRVFVWRRSVASSRAAGGAGPRSRAAVR